MDPQVAVVAQGEGERLGEVADAELDRGAVRDLLGDEAGDRVVAVVRRRVVDGREPTPIRPATLVGPPGLVQGAATPVLDACYADPLAWQ